MIESLEDTRENWDNCQGLEELAVLIFLVSSLSTGEGSCLYDPDWIVSLPVPSQLPALKLFCMQNFEVTATESFLEAGSSGLRVFIGVWSFLFLKTHKLKDNIYIYIKRGMECVVYTCQLKMIFCSVFEQVKGICPFCNSVWIV